MAKRRVKDYEQRTNNSIKFNNGLIERETRDRTNEMYRWEIFVLLLFELDKKSSTSSTACDIRFIGVEDRPNSDLVIY